MATDDPAREVRSEPTLNRGIALVPGPRGAPLEEQTLRVTVVACSRLLADTLVLALHGQTEIRVIATAFDGNPADRALASLASQPDVMVVQHSAMTDIGAAGLLGPTLRRTRLVVTSLPDDMDVVMRWAEAGATGLLTNDSSLRELVATIRLVSEGKGSCSPAITAMMLENFRALGTPLGRAAGLQNLTRRESQVARLLELGLSNTEIARHLGITIATVKNHVHNILTKLDLPSRGRVRLRRPINGHGIDDT